MKKRQHFSFCLLMGSTDKSANMKCFQPCPLNNLKLKYSDFLSLIMFFLEGGGAFCTEAHHLLLL